MSNSSDTYKTGERVPTTAEYVCCICMQGGKNTEVRIEAGGIFPNCELCETKETTFRLKSAVIAR